MCKVHRKLARSKILQFSSTTITQTTVVLHEEVRAPVVAI